MHTTPVAITGGAGADRPLILDPAFAHRVVAFLDGDSITVHMSTDRLPIYPSGARRHTILAQIPG